MKNIKVITENMAKKEIVNKEYQLINARYKLTSVQTKIILKIIALINNKKDTELLTYQIPLSYFDFLTENKNHNILKNESIKLMEKVLEIDTSDGWLLVHWFSSIEYKRKENIIECSIDSKLKPYLLQLKNKFKPYEIKYVMKMDSEYAMRIYELCKQYQDTFTKKREFEITELHELMKVPITYIQNFKNFRIKVLDIAVREINKHSDIKISYEAKKRGRAVFWIEFTITKNESNIIEAEAIESVIVYDEIKHKEFKVLFKRFGFEDDIFYEEFKNFCLYNNDDESKVIIDNFTKWCMQKKRKITIEKNKNTEKNEYTWSFKKAKATSDKIKNYFMFDVGLDWKEEFYWKDIKSFDFEGIRYGWQKVMHPVFSKEETLLFIIADDEFLAKTDKDIIDVDVS